MLLSEHLLLLNFSQVKIIIVFSFTKSLFLHFVSLFDGVFGFEYKRYTRYIFIIADYITQFDMKLFFKAFYMIPSTDINIINQSAI